jgi:hypothetical protein
MITMYLHLIAIKHFAKTTENNTFGVPPLHIYNKKILSATHFEMFNIQELSFQSQIIFCPFFRTLHPLMIQTMS